MYREGIGVDQRGSWPDLPPMIESLLPLLVLIALAIAFSWAMNGCTFRDWSNS